MASRVSRSRREVLVMVAILALILAAPTAALARDTFDIAGTVESKNEEKETIVFITDDLGKKGQPITIDMSHMSSEFEAIKVGQSASFSIEQRESNSYLAHVLVSQGSYVHRTDFGASQVHETRDSSIKAHVAAVPDDDESLAQQHRNNNLRRPESDD